MTPPTPQHQKLPIGIQTFAEIRQEGYYYVDKTTLILRLFGRKKVLLPQPTTPLWQKLVAHLVPLLEKFFANQLSNVADLKILHYPVVVCPKLTIAMSKSTSEDEILTIKQVADYLKVTERTIYRLAAAKQIPAFKVGGSWRFSRADIDSWIKQQSMEGLETSRQQDGDATG